MYYFNTKSVILSVIYTHRQKRAVLCVRRWRPTAVKSHEEEIGDALFVQQKQTEQMPLWIKFELNKMLTFSRRNLDRIYSVVRHLHPLSVKSRLSAWKRYAKLAANSYVAA